MTDQDIIRQMEEQGKKRRPGMSIHCDTSEFMNLKPGDVILLQGTPYWISRDERESGFGMEDSQKFWVKRTTNLITKEIKIIKLVFFEEFWQKLGDIYVRFYRSPQKEADVLEAVSNNPFFMHGTWTTDGAKNNVRIIDFIRGPSLHQLVCRLNGDHKHYFTKELKPILTDTLKCLEALTFLHDNDLVHGDVRWDHILWDRIEETYRWIDFDYNYIFPENPFGADIFGMGTILANVIGKGALYLYDIKTDPSFRDLVPSFVGEDFSILEGKRFMNLRKIYPYIPERLNTILLHFSGHAEVFYESVEEIVFDLKAALKEMY